MSLKTTIEQSTVPFPAEESFALFFLQSADEMYNAQIKLVVGSCRYDFGSVWAALIIGDKPGEVGDSISEEPHWDHIFEHPLFPGVEARDASEAIEKLVEKCRKIKMSHKLTVDIWNACNQLLEHDQYNFKADKAKEILDTHVSMHIKECPQPAIYPEA